MDCKLLVSIFEYGQYMYLSLRFVIVYNNSWRPLEKDDAVQPTLVRMPRNKYPIVVESL